MKPRVLLLFVVMAALVLAAAVSGKRPALATGGSVYQDSRGRFTILVPPGWKAAEAEGGARLSRGDAYVNVMVVDGQRGWDLGEQIVGQIRQQWRNFQEVERGERQLGTLPATFGVYRGVNPKKVSAMMKVFVASGSGRTFLMMMSWPQAQMASLSRDINQIEQSFSVGDAGAFPGGVPPTPMPAPMPGSAPPPAYPQAGPQPSPNRAILGVLCRDLTPQDIATLAAATSQGTLIVQVGPNTPAARAGLQPNDVIGAIDRQPVMNTPDLIRIIGGYRPGDTIEIFIIRQGKPRSFRVQLAGQS